MIERGEETPICFCSARICLPYVPLIPLLYARCTKDRSFRPFLSQRDGILDVPLWIKLSFFSLTTNNINHTAWATSLPRDPLCRVRPFQGGRSRSLDLSIARIGCISVRTSATRRVARVVCNNNGALLKFKPIFTLFSFPFFFFFSSSFFPRSCSKRA